MSEIGQRLRAERERLGFNQATFGAIGSVRQQAQLKYEKGERSPDAEYLGAIAKVGADVQYILTGVHSSTAFSPEEQLMLDRYRASPRELRDAALRVLLGANASENTGNNAENIAEGAQVAQGSGIVQVSTGRRIPPTKKN